MRLQLKGGQLSHKAHIFAKFSQRLFKALFRHNKLKVIARNMNFVAFTFIFISNSFILQAYKQEDFKWIDIGYMYSTGK